MPSAPPWWQEAGAPCSGRNYTFHHLIVCYSHVFSPGWGEKRVFSWFSQQLDAVIACRAQGSCTSAAWEGSAKASVGRTNSRHIFTLFCAKTVPVPDSEIEKHLWSFLTLLLYLLTMFLRHCLSMRNALHLLKIPPASLLAILNCWASLLGSTERLCPCSHLHWECGWQQKMLWWWCHRQAFLVDSCVKHKYVSK